MYFKPVSVCVLFFSFVITFMVDGHANPVPSQERQRVSIEHYDDGKVKVSKKNSVGDTIKGEVLHYAEVSPAEQKQHTGEVDGVMVRNSPDASASLVTEIESVVVHSWQTLKGYSHSVIDFTQSMF